MLDKLKCLFYAFVLLAPCYSIYAQGIQSDSTYHIEGVVITSNRLTSFTTGSKIVELDSTVLSQNSNNTLAELLANQSQVFIKSYSIAGLSTPSFRGMNAGQTAILWNGFNVSSPMNGGQDLALLPVNFVNNVKLQYGGAGALWGSGAIGGTIHLNNIPEFDKGLSAGTSLSYGSFNDQQENIEVGISKKRFISTTKFFHHQAKNNFTYNNIALKGKPEQQMKNAEFNQNGVLQENYFKLNASQSLSFRLWYQQNSRNIPGSMTSIESQSNQVDEAFRSTIEWQRIKDKTSYFLRAAYFDETLNYTDPSINLTSNSQTKSFISEAEVKYKLTPNQFLNVGINNTYNLAITKNYASNPTQNRTSLFGSYQLKNKKSTLRSTVSVRKEFISNGLSPFTASVGAEAWFLKNIRLRGLVSKNYRIPTFNDLYWAQGGNPNLKPEDGLSEEMGLAYILHKEKFDFEYEITAFSSRVNNWIMWTPNNAGIWSPQNVSKVWSRGIENDLKIHYTIGKVKLNAGFHYQFIQTTNEEINTADQSSLHQQLIYTPTNKSISTIGIEYRGFRIGCTYNYVGYRYTTSDNSQFLKPYYTINVDVSKHIVLSHLKMKAYVQVNNITQESYQIIAYYAMPKQSFQIGLILNINQPNK